MPRSEAIARLLRRAKGEAGAEAQTNGAADGAATVFGPRSGPAAIFEAIRSGRAGLAAEDQPEDDGTTYVLLSQLDRMWRHPERREA